MSTGAPGGVLCAPLGATRSSQPLGAAGEPLPASRGTLRRNPWPGSSDHCRSRVFHILPTRSPELQEYVSRRKSAPAQTAAGALILTRINYRADAACDYCPISAAICNHTSLLDFGKYTVCNVSPWNLPSPIRGSLQDGSSQPRPCRAPRPFCSRRLGRAGEGGGPWWHRGFCCRHRRFEARAKNKQSREDSHLCIPL